MTNSSRRPVPSQSYTVVWHGGLVDELGTNGGLLPPYESRSSWRRVEEVLEELLDREEQDDE